MVWPKSDWQGSYIVNVHCQYHHPPTVSAISNFIKEEYQLVSKLLVYSLMFHTVPLGHSAWLSGKGI